MKPRLLVNENFPAPSTALLRSRGLDVLSIAERPPGVCDADVLAPACSEARWLLTFDVDYGELIFGRRMPSPPAVILIREPHYRLGEPGEWVLKLAESPETCAGFFSVLPRAGLRKRPLLRTS